MKRIVILLLIFSVSFLTASAQLFGKSEPPPQIEANALRVYVWEYPGGDSLAHKDLLQDTAYAVIMWRYNGSPIEVMMSPVELRDLREYFFDSVFIVAQQTGVYGFELVVSYNKELSRLKESDLNAIQDKKKKRVAQALNNTAKYTLRAGLGMPKLVLGKRLIEKDEVRIVPDFTTNQQDMKDDQTTPTQAKDDKKGQIISPTTQPSGNKVRKPKPRVG